MEHDHVANEDLTFWQYNGWVLLATIALIALTFISVFTIGAPNERKALEAERQERMYIP